MNTKAKSLHDEKLESLASDYARRGFVVVKEPSAKQLPFDLGEYRPDLVASKDSAGVIIEVKTSASRISVDRFQQVADEVSTHPGWRFLLVTLDDVDTREIPTTASELPDWAQLDEKLKRLDGMMAMPLLEPGLLYLWSIFEAALRRRAIAQNIPVERLPANMLLKHLYSQGEVSVDQVDVFQAFLEKRNRLAHGGNEVLDPEFIRMLIRSVKDVIEEWREGTRDDSQVPETA
jgi:hypothetical protein